MIGDQTSIKTDYKLVLRKQKCEWANKTKGLPKQMEQPFDFEIKVVKDADLSGQAAN